jgi:catechol 2,3-dioxygenase-like lactoylglutathione lyase family enzyme
MVPTVPPLSRVLETALYFTDEARTEAFYGEVMGFRLLDREPGRSLFYRAGASVFLLFRAEASRLGGRLPPHGAQGSVHTCFLVPREHYHDWKSYLAGRGVAILQEVAWAGGSSFYFHDPDGNLLEIADADIRPA